MIKTIKNMRKKIGMSRADLAYALGVTETTVSYWERKLGKPSKLALKMMEPYFKEANSKPRKEN